MPVAVVQGEGGGMSGYRPRGNAQRHPDKAITAKEAEAQMVFFLYNCRPTILDSLTVESLQRMYRVTAKVAEYRLLVARQNRQGEVR